MLRLVRTDASDLDFQNLIVLLDEELHVRDGDEHAFFAQFNKPEGLLGVVVAYFDDMPVGCGAFKRFSETEAEIKRMFVRAESRGRRTAAHVLAELEAWAAEGGFTACVLETGFKNPEAIALYQRSGYEIIPNYGQYVDVASSLCMRRGIEAKIALP